MSWFAGQKDKIVNKMKSDYTKTHQRFLQMQTPLTDRERLEHWIKLGLWLICSLMLFILIDLDWFTIAGLYAIVMMMLFWLKGWDPIARKIAQYWQQCSLEQTNIDPKLLNVPHSVIAEQRLVNILAIGTDWQALSSKDRHLKALRALDAIYRVAVGITIPIDGELVTTDTSVPASVDEVMSSTETSTKIQKDDKS